MLTIVVIKKTTRRKNPPMATRQNRKVLIKAQQKRKNWECQPNTLYCLSYSSRSEEMSSFLTGYNNGSY